MDSRSPISIFALIRFYLCLSVCICGFVRLWFSPCLFGRFLLRDSPRKAWPRVARPTQSGQAATKGASDGRREKRLDIVQSALDGCVTRCFMKREKAFPTAPRCAGSGIVQQIGFSGESLKNRH